MAVRAPRAFLLVLLLAVVQLAPWLARSELRHEEGRRATPAREMIERGDYVLPTVWGEPYLNKPPLVYWAVAVASAPLGAVTALSARLPAVLATLALLLATLAFGRRLVGARAALYAAAMLAVAPLVLEKGRTAEIEPLFGLFAFLAVAAWWRGRAGSAAMTLGAGLALAAALLAKGPPALVFFLSAPLGLAVARRDASFVLSWRLCVPLLFGLALAAVWPWLVFQRMGASATVALWLSELGARGATGLSGWLADRATFVAGALGGFLPAALIVLLCARSATWRALRGEEGARLAFWAVAPAAVVFLLAPGARARYAYPLLPWVALLAGRLVVALADGPASAPAGRRVRAATGILALLALAAGGALVASARWPLSGVSADGLGLALALALAVAARAAWRAARAGRTAVALGSALAILLLLSQVQLSQVQRAAAARQDARERASEIRAFVPEGRVLRVASRGEFNLLFHVGRELRAAPELASLSPGELLYASDDFLARIESAAPFAFEPLLALEGRRGRRGLLLRVLR